MAEYILLYIYDYTTKYVRILLYIYYFTTKFVSW